VHFFVIILYMLCENYMHKGQEGENVKMSYEFGNNLMKIMCLEEK
jgi:hypothetical protein